MVRIIVGTLLDISKGSAKDIKTILNSQNRKNAGITAKAQGLFFTGAKYEKIDLDISSSSSNPLNFLMSSKI